MKPIGFFLLFWLFWSCQTQKNIDYNQSIAGEYATPDIRRRTLYDFLLSNYYYLNTHLKVNKDKTFEIQTCSYTAKGKWFISKDTFHYKYDTLIWLIDSLNYSGKYKERKNKLIRYDRFLIIKKDGLFRKTKEGKKNLIMKLVK